MTALQATQTTPMFSPEQLEKIRSNYTPNPDECRDMLSCLSIQDTQIPSSEAENQTAAFYRAVLAPIRTLPNEVLLEIFEIFAVIPRPPPSMMPQLVLKLYPPPFRIGHVCFRWRTLSYALNHWWRNINIDLYQPHTVQQAELLSSRAADELLDVAVTTTALHYYRHHNDVPTVKRFAFRARSLEVWPEMLAQLLRSTAELPHVQVLKISFPGTMPINTATLIQDARACARLPSLRDLHIERASLKSAVSWITFTPTLHNIASWIIPLPQITSLTLKNLEINNVAICLKSIPRLQHLSLISLLHTGAINAADEIVLPNLLSLDASLTHSHAAFHWIYTHLTCPNLKLFGAGNISIMSPMWNQGQTTPSWTDTHFTQITTLRLGNQIETDAFSRFMFLPRMDNLETVDVELDGMASRDSGELKWVDSLILILPSLEVIKYRGEVVWEKGRGQVVLRIRPYDNYNKSAFQDAVIGGFQ